MSYDYNDSNQFTQQTSFQFHADPYAPRDPSNHGGASFFDSTPLGGSGPHTLSDTLQPDIYTFTGIPQSSSSRSVQNVYATQLSASEEESSSPAHPTLRDVQRLSECTDQPVTNVDNQYTLDITHQTYGTFQFLEDTPPESTSDYVWVPVPRHALRSGLGGFDKTSLGTPQTLTPESLPESSLLQATALSLDHESVPQLQIPQSMDRSGRRPISRDHRAGSHQCQICSQSFSSQRSLKRHETGHETYICLDCPEKHRKPLKLSQKPRHMKDVHGDRPFKCICGKSFQRKANFDRHDQKHECVEGKSRQLTKRRRNREKLIQDY